MGIPLRSKVPGTRLSLLGVASVSLRDIDLITWSGEPFAPVGFPTIGNRVGELAASCFWKSPSFAVGDETEQFGFRELAVGEQVFDERDALRVEEFSESLVLRDGALLREFLQRKHSPLLRFLIEPLAQFGSSFGRLGKDSDPFIGPARDLMFGEVIGQDDVRQFVDQQFVDARRIVGAKMQAAHPNLAVAHFQIGEAPRLGGEASQALELFARRIQKQIALQRPCGVVCFTEPACAQRLTSSFADRGQSLGDGRLADVMNPKRA